MIRFGPKKEKPEDWKPRKPRKLVIDEKCLNALPSCPECRGRGYKVVGVTYPDDAGGLAVNVMAYCECVLRQLSKADRDATIVVRSP